VTLVEGSAFCISSASGDIAAGTAQGLFFRDTRFLSRLELRLNEHRPTCLSVHAAEPFSAVFVLQGAPGGGDREGGLLLVRRRYLGRGMREDLVLRNFGVEPAYCSLELLFDADFADLFGIRHGAATRLGDVELVASTGGLEFRYQRGARTRGVRVALDPAPKVAANVASYELIVAPGGTWEACLELAPVIDAHVVEVLHPCGAEVAGALEGSGGAEWRRDLPRIETDGANLATALRRSVEDIGALRLLDPERPGLAPVAAGAPWAMTLYGRDSLVASLLALVLDPDLALGTLRTLARFQGSTIDPRTEEEPGRILDEVRFADAGDLSLGGGRVTYGSADATPLFVMLLGELRRWGLAAEAVDGLLPAADRALEWMTTYGDRDGDGFIEYERASNRGPRHQGWKNSPGSVRFADGTTARPPLALCEVQGYAYAAYLARAFFAEEAGDGELAASWRRRAVELKERFGQAFWLADRGYYAVALDADKRPVDAKASNMGHCLWTGIVEEHRAASVAEHLVGEDLFSGWGIRTMAASTAGFDPLGYHTGSVWPHDNAICAAGLMRYGFVEAAHRVIAAVLEAAAASGGQLPGLYAGLDRREVPFPVRHPWACRPQAWAAAAPLSFLRTILRLDPWVPRGKVWLSPALPEGVTRVEVDGMALAGRVTITVDGDRVTVDGLPESVALVAAPRRPLTA